jgi:hypothetical protein
MEKIIKEVKRVVNKVKNESGDFEFVPNTGTTYNFKITLTQDIQDTGYFDTGVVGYGSLKIETHHGDVNLDDGTYQYEIPNTIKITATTGTPTWWILDGVLFPATSNTFNVELTALKSNRVLKVMFNN